jgi:hypothetical protein
MTRRWARLSLGALALAACGEPPEEIVPPVAIEAFTEEAKQAHCEWAVRCRHVPDDDACRRLLEPKFYDSRRAEDAVRAGRLAYDATEAGRCLRATALASCAARPFTDLSCDRMLSGRIPEGGACTSHGECEGRSRCEDTECGAQCCAGTCGAPEPPPPNEPPLAEVGEACETHFDCVREAYCETDGRCEALPDEPGQRCLFGCLPGDLYCDVGSLECRAYAGLGEACDPDRLTAPPCNEAWAVCRAGTCHPRPGPGESCVTHPDRCVVTTRCLAGICQPRGEPGDPCEADADCDWLCDEDAGVCLGYETCRVD